MRRALVTPSRVSFVRRPAVAFWSAKRATATMTVVCMRTRSCAPPRPVPAPEMRSTVAAPSALTRAKSATMPMIVETTTNMPTKKDVSNTKILYQ